MLNAFLDKRNAGWVLFSTAICIIATAIGGYLTTSEWLTILYLFPMAVSACFLRRDQILALALACAVLRVSFSQHFLDLEVFARFAEEFIICASSGLFVSEVLLARRRAAEQADLLQAAREEARMLLESSPVAVVTVAARGQILLANEAASQLLGIDTKPDAKPEQITDYVPALKNVFNSQKVGPFVRTMLEGSARNRAGDALFVQMWLSSYETSMGRRVAVIFSDASEGLRDREEVGLRQLLTSSQIIVGAMSHEVRNLSAAASALHGNLQKRLDLSQDPDFAALGTLVHSLRQIASSEIPSFAEQTLGVNVAPLLDELKIIVGNGFRDQDIELIWEVSEDLPVVRADRSALLQVLLNIVQNAGRAVEGRNRPSVRITAYQLEGDVILSIWDNGPGLALPELVFQPFQPGATSTGLGLYVSRAIVRTFGGELAYDKRASGGCFVVHLTSLADGTKEKTSGGASREVG